MLELIYKLKMKPEVFKALLERQTRHDVSLSTSQIIRGNKSANILVSVMTNPHCSPCADMHQRTKKLLEIAKDRICVQYIYASFDENLDSCKLLIAVYLSDMDEKQKETIYDEWFEKGRYEKEKFYEKYKLDIHDPAVETEINNHKEWRGNVELHATPTILVNGYELPDHYRIEDLVYFTGI